MSQLKVFISYSSLDKSLAGLFKQCFENYAGFSVFLAHEDISPALDWELKIIKNLKEVDIVIPLITDNFRNSDFTDQELGMALAWEKIILPIKLVDINPYGFIKKLQALNCHSEQSDVIDAVITIVLALIDNDEFNIYKDLVIDSVVEAFCKSNSYKTTSIIIRILTKIENFNTNQIVRVKNAIKNNNQVYGFFALPDFIKFLSDNHKIVIDS
ncbi:conserved hypothetical protein [Candidatus Roizmanbacteria bacterium]|nr:conserved hypothetical protein [Candidatus Roizmanbacteria bacterium]